jgi:pimeloyl-ACP methyl ester carboxylesterase
MKPETDGKNQSKVIAQEHYTNDSVTSKDGTIIGYRQIGRGSGLVVLHGIMESSQSHTQLAEALADSFTVYLPDRRGRGNSGSYGNDYNIQKEVEDIDVLLTKTGAQYIFGVSMGAVISLQAALSLPAIQKIALFDPPLIINGSVSTDFLARYNEEISQGDIISALVTAMQGSQMGPPIFNSMPRWLLAFLTKMIVISEDKNAKSGDITMRMLAPTLRYDLQLAIEVDGKQESFKNIQNKVLLLGASNSPAYMKVALDALEKILPQSERIEFIGLNHGASGNTNRGGQPKRVAQELRRFFA